MECSATWIDGFRFRGVDSDGRELKMDASKGAGGEGDGYRPAELPLMGLAGCTGIDTVEILQKMRQQVTGLEVSVKAEKAGGDKGGYAEIEVRYVVRGSGLDRAKVERAVELSERKYCTVGRALSAGTTISHEIEIVEE